MQGGELQEACVPVQGVCSHGLERQELGLELVRLGRGGEQRPDSDHAMAVPRARGERRRCPRAAIMLTQGRGKQVDDGVDDGDDELATETGVDDGGARDEGRRRRRGKQTLVWLFSSSSCSRLLRTCSSSATPWRRKLLRLVKGGGGGCSR